jgi:2'-5' RNA ligase
MLSFKQFLMEDDGGMTTTTNIVGGNPLLFGNIAKRKPLVEDTYDYASCQFIFDKYLSDQICEYAKFLVSPDDLHENGYIKDPHITVQYGLLSDEPTELFKLLEQELLKPTYVKILETSVFECDDYNVLILGIHSDKLNRLNKSISDNIKIAESKHQIYNPHVTLAYLKKDIDYEKYLYKTDLSQLNVRLRNFQFSNKLGEIINFS